MRRSLPACRSWPRCADCRPGAREALVLTYYLDLTEQQAAAMAGISLTALRRNLAVALGALPCGPARPLIVPRTDPRAA